MSSIKDKRQKKTEEALVWRAQETKQLRDKQQQNKVEPAFSPLVGQPVTAK